MWRLIPVISATQEVEMRRITVHGQPGQKIIKIPSQPIKLGIIPAIQVV
jgi:hypothetical protein